MNYLRPAVYNSGALVLKLAHNFVGYAVDTFDLVPYFVQVPFDGDDSWGTYCPVFVPHAFVMWDTVTFFDSDNYKCRRNIMQKQKRLTNDRPRSSLFDHVVLNKFMII